MVLHPALTLRHCLRIGGRLALALAGLWLTASCQPKPVPPVKPPPVNPTLPSEKTLPEFLQTTLMDYTILDKTTPFVVSSYGLVVNLRGTGNCDCPTAVHQWMVTEMLKHGWGSYRLPGPARVEPETVLRDKRVAIVEVAAFIPPGARQGDLCDVVVKAPEGNRTTSLARGLLYECSLRIDGVDAANPGGAVNEYALAEGYLVVNPLYAINQTADPRAIASLRMATIPGGAVVRTKRELELRLRDPQWAMAAHIEKRINEFFQDFTVAKAQDDSLVYLYPPARYHGDWKHFTGVVRHMYLNSTPEFLANKAAELALQACKPDAPLMDISYALEAIGPQALHVLPALIASQRPEIAYAAARAGAFLDDRFAQEELIRMARDPNHPFQRAAIADFDELPATPFINAALEDLLSQAQPEVRIAAYKVLVRNNDSHIFTKAVYAPADEVSSFQLDAAAHKLTELPPRVAKPRGFLLDIVDCGGPPLIYATRVGEARVAIFGQKVAMKLPSTFAAFDARLTISTDTQQPRYLTIYYRNDERPRPVQVASMPDLGQLIAHLGGVDEEGLDLTFGEVITVLQSMAASDTLADAQRSRVQFVLEDLPASLQRINQAQGLGSPERAAAENYVVPATLPIVEKAPVPTQPSTKPGAATAP